MVAWLATHARTHTLKSPPSLESFTNRVGYDFDGNMIKKKKKKEFTYNKSPLTHRTGIIQREKNLDGSIKIPDFWK